MVNVSATDTKKSKVGDYPEEKKFYRTPHFTPTKKGVVTPKSKICE